MVWMFLSGVLLAVQITVVEALRKNVNPNFFPVLFAPATFGICRWVQEMEWKLTTPPVIDPEQFLGICGPFDMEFQDITPRK